MTSYVSAELRGLVEVRAENLCEYCLLHGSDTFLGCQVDHIIAEKHGGATNESNLCLACTLCNRAKGSDIGSLTQDGEFIRFYNPRIDLWYDHFSLNDVAIESRRLVGEVTVRILGFNDSDRLLERTMLRKLGRYASERALARINRMKD